MASIFSINQLNINECNAMIEELKSLDPSIEKKVDHVMKATSVDLIKALEYVVIDNPILWAKVYLNWTCRDYQFPILLEGKKSKQLVLRLGRRLGKTDSMCVLILWYAYTQINKGPNDQYNILILTPYETQIDLIFDRLKQLIDGSPLMTNMLSREIHHRKEFSNGTIIVGLTAGASSGNSGSNNTRGQRADILVFDEVDYIGSSQLTNAINIRNEAPERIKIIAASTPSGKHEEFYKWCIDSSRSYKPKKDDINNFRFTGYTKTEAKDTGEKGNGWTEIYAPSVVNKELLKINPDTKQTYLQDIKDELSELRYEQEVMAMFGDEELGVYQKIYIQKAIEEGKRINHKYVNKLDSNSFNKFLRNKTGPRILGVDWDKYQSGTTFVALELDKLYINENGVHEPKFKVLFRIEIPKSSFTYVNAVNKIVELNDVYDFDWIAVDRGYGETQIELLHKYGIENPHTGLHDKVIGYQFGQKLEVRDPHTMQKDKKPLKPFMVNNSVVVFEKCKIVLDPTDKILREQLESYRIKSISTTGVPTFTDENEHAIDALNLCLLIFEQKYGTLLKTVISSRILSVDEFKRNEDMLERGLDFSNNEEASTLIYYSPKTRHSSYSRTSAFGGYGNSSSSGMFRRGSF